MSRTARDVRMGGTAMFKRHLGSMLFALFVLAPGIAPALDSGFDPPIAFYVNEPFGRDGAPFNPSAWQAIGGNWQGVAGTYNSTVASANALTTLFEYFIDPIAAPPEPAPSSNFTYRARIMNAGATATQLAGVIYNYFDADSYDEAVFSPTGTMFLRHVNNGTVTTFLTNGYSGGARNVWFDVSLTVSNRRLTIAV